MEKENDTLKQKVQNLEFLQKQWSSEKQNLLAQMRNKSDSSSLLNMISDKDIKISELEQQLKNFKSEFEAEHNNTLIEKDSEIESLSL